MGRRPGSGRSYLGIAARKHFEKYSENGVVRVRCNFCSLTRSDNITRLVDHLRKDCMQIPDEIRKTFVQEEKKDKMVQSSIRFQGQGSQGQGSHQRANYLLAKWLHQSGQPLSLVDDRGFREMLLLFDRNYTPPTSQEIGKLIDEQFNGLQNMVKET